MDGVYDFPRPMGRAEAQSVFASGDADATCIALLSLALHNPNRRWVQQWCVRLAAHPAANVRGIATTSLAHLARLQGRLDEEPVLPVLERLLQDPQTTGYAEDAMDTIAVFLRRSGRPYRELLERHRRPSVPGKGG